MNYTPRFVAAAVLGAGLVLGGCGDDGLTDLIPDAGLPIPDVVKEAAKQCGIDVDCEGGGIAEGNASISGVASVDAFFASVLKFQAKADSVASGIDAEVAAIRADFGIDADANLETALKAQIEANVEGSLRVEAEPARCQVDAQATVEATARCEGMVSPGSASVRCEGSCEVEASADVSCSAEAQLKCTFTAPAVECMGECRGSCEVTGQAALSCDGVCRGECSAGCEVMNAQGECQGKCAGECMGSCETELGIAASCSGTCRGECVVTEPEGGCEGAVSASCEATGSAMVDCQGRCEGNFEPPEASVECEASAKAEASLNVECTPPRVVIDYELKAVAGAELEAQARFQAAVSNLEVRLPALLASIEKGSVVADAGLDLTSDATGAVRGALSDLSADGNLRVQFGLVCAVQELGAVQTAIADSSSALTGSLGVAAEIKAGLGI